MSRMPVNFIDPVTDSAQRGIEGVRQNANQEADRVLERTRIAIQAQIAKAQIDAEKQIATARLQAESSARQTDMAFREKELLQRQTQEQARLDAEAQEAEKQRQFVIGEADRRWSRQKSMFEEFRKSFDSKGLEESMADMQAVLDESAVTDASLLAAQSALEQQQQKEVSYEASVLRKLPDLLAAHSAGVSVGAEATIEAFQDTAFEAKMKDPSFLEAFVTRSATAGPSTPPGDLLEARIGAQVVDAVRSTEAYRRLSEKVVNFFGLADAENAAKLTNPSTSTLMLAEMAAATIPDKIAEVDPTVNPDAIRDPLLSLVGSLLLAARDDKARAAVADDIASSVQALRDQGLSDGVIQGVVDGLQSLGSASKKKAGEESKTAKTIRDFTEGTQMSKVGTIFQGSLLSRGVVWHRDPTRAMTETLESFAAAWADRIDPNVPGELEEFIVQMRKAQIAPDDVVTLLKGWEKTRGEATPQSIKNTIKSLEAKKQSLLSKQRSIENKQYLQQRSEDMQRTAFQTFMGGG